MKTFRAALVVAALAACGTGPLEPAFEEGLESAPGPSIPFGLTATDGTGLVLESLGVSAFVQRPLAFTELRLAFRNPGDRVLEGRFRVAIPPGGSVSRFAMRVGDAWQEGEVVEQSFGQRTFEDFLHRKQDPALLERQAANEFTARVFPINPRSTRELIVAFTHPVADRWVQPLRGLPAIGRFEARVLVQSGAGQRELTLDRASWAPDRDLAVRLPDDGSQGLRNGRLAVLRVRPEGACWRLCA
jgi:hypothetical protein